MAKDHPWPTDNKEHEVFVESIRLEKCRVKIKPGDSPDVEVLGLVVRLDYAPNQGPFFVQLPNWKGGQQHRFYTRAGKSTVVFWPMNKEAANQIAEMHLISVAACKHQALTVDPLSLGKPNERTGPQP